MNDELSIITVYIAIFLFCEKLSSSLGLFVDMFVVNVLRFFNLTVIAYIEYSSGTFFKLFKAIGAFFTKYF